MGELVMLPQLWVAGLGGGHVASADAGTAFLVRAGPAEATQFQGREFALEFSATVPPA